MSFGTSASLQLKNIDDFHRVLEFVKPDESDTEPQTDAEYKEVMNFLDNLQVTEQREPSSSLEWPSRDETRQRQGPERCAWMTKHCTRFYVNFRAEPEIKELSWSGRNIQGGYACEIAELVVAQFPDIEFRICTGSGPDDLKFGISDQGKIRWQELSDDVKEMFEWGIDVDPYVGPTPEQLEELHQHRRARVQEMIDLGVDISIDTWPPTQEHFIEELNLKYADNNESKTEVNKDADNPDLPF